MKKKYIICVIFLFLLLIQSGCWDRRELETLGIVMSMEIDKNSANEIQCALALVRPPVAAGGGGSAGNKLGESKVVLVGRGRTTFEAIRNIYMQSSRQLFFGQEMVLIITERAAKDGIADILDLIMREHEFRRLIKIFITKDPFPISLLAQPEIEITLTKEIINTSENGQFNGKAPSIDINEFVRVLTSDVPNPVAPLLITERTIQQKKFYEEQTKQASLTPFIRGMAVFKGENFVGELDTITTRGWMFVKNRIKSSIIVITAPGLEGKYASMEITKSKADITTSIVDDVPNINVQVKAEVNLVEEMSSEDLTKKEVIKQVEKLTAEAIDQEIKKAIDKAQLELQVDFFQFGEDVHHQQKEYWKVHKSQWENIFPNVKITTDVKVTLRRTGLQSKPINVK